VFFDLVFLIFFLIFFGFLLVFLFSLLLAKLGRREGNLKVCVDAIKPSFGRKSHKPRRPNRSSSSTTQKPSVSNQVREQGHEVRAARSKR